MFRRRGAGPLAIPVVRATMWAMVRRNAWLLLALFGPAILACDEKKESAPPAPSASAAPKETAALGPPPVARPPLVSLDDTACYVGGDKVDFAAPDPRGRLVATVGQKERVANEMLEVQASRDAKTPKVAMVLAVLEAAKAKGALVKTAGRDGAQKTIELHFDHAPLAACSPAALIGKDGAIQVWPAGGGTGARFTRGMAGPDMTRGTAAVRKHAASCDSPAWAVGADDAVQWGLVFDLVQLSLEPTDAGKAPGATSLVIPEKAPSPGRKVGP
jgi:hypothetical protein